MVILRLATQARSCPRARGDKLWSFYALCQPRGTNSTVSGWCVGTDHVQIFAGSAGREIHRPNGVSLEQKLVSSLYFPFISNKRQVKRGNCHTLISSGDHPLLGCDPRLTTSRYLASIVRQFVKFWDVPEVKRKHCSTIHEVPWHKLKGSVSAQSVKFRHVPEGKKGTIT